MTVRHGLVALLAERPMGVYELRKEFDARTGGTWPLNIGQVYTTIQRLVRDGVVELVPLDYGAGEAEPYRLTPAGYDEAEVWWTRPVDRSVPGRDELVIKLALAAASPDVDVPAVVHTQRIESMRALRDYTRLKARQPQDPSTREDLAWTLVLDNLVFAAEAEVRWLDHVEASVGRFTPPPPAAEEDDDGGAGPEAELASRSARRSGAAPTAGERP
ncbi:transcriptional regulator [Serinibacter arcticus]|uniref:Transcriptional regulator n=1 Tax=Serinibacter arcticus TaxID=1655435 RepID=A0A2U1ZU78_9MICO|nr:PadR family transcriptional regulator [Serinibacter arcticus]PWD50500.1 transcriptional regulator [Serinibacter arcticus]